LDQTSKVKILKTLYQRVEVVQIKAEMRQDALLGDGDTDISPIGHVFISLIPSCKNTDAFSGQDAGTVNSVPGKLTFPMSVSELKTFSYDFVLDGYELDLAQDPRRGAGIVLWTGNTGAAENQPRDQSIASVTWYVTVDCSGPSVLW